MIRETIDEASGGRYRFSVGSSPDINYYSNGGSDDWVRGEGGDKYFLQGHSAMAKVGLGNRKRKSMFNLFEILEECSRVFSDLPCVKIAYFFRSALSLRLLSAILK